MKILIFSLYILLNINHNRIHSCNDFKIGNFQINDSSINSFSTFERNDSIQIEKDLKTGDVSKYKLKWVGNCEYELEIYEGSEEKMAFLKGKVIDVKIIELLQNGYKFEATVSGYDFKVFQTAIKIDD